MIGCVLLAGPPAVARPKHRAPKATASLLVSFEVSNDADTVHQAWFVDGEGRTYWFARAGGRDPLAEAERAGGLTARDVSALVAASRPMPNTVPAGELDRARALLPGAQHSMVWTHRRRDPCKGGVTVAIRAYLFAAGRPAEAIPLRETTCNWLVDENLSPEAQELIEWVYRQSGQPRPRLRR
jgi:hypothetical protein